jgi:hypothetical protein
LYKPKFIFSALNYDPDAIMDDGTCTYTSTIDTPPQFVPGPLPIPVTGEVDVLIPVTGVDVNDTSFGLFEIVIALFGSLVVASSMIIFAKKKVI